MEQVTITLTGVRRGVCMPDFTDRKFTLTPRTSVMPIGRSSNHSYQRANPRSNNAFFKSPVISRRHAELFINPDIEHCVQIKDLGSLHGTIVNSINLKKGEKTRLLNGDTITIGSDVAHREKSYLAQTFRITYKWESYSEPNDRESTQVFTTAVVNHVSERPEKKIINTTFSVPDISTSDSDSCDSDNGHDVKEIQLPDDYSSDKVKEDALSGPREPGAARTDSYEFACNPLSLIDKLGLFRDIKGIATNASTDQWPGSSQHNPFTVDDDCSSSRVAPPAVFIDLCQDPTPDKRFFVDLEGVVNEDCNSADPLKTQGKAMDAASRSPSPTMLTAVSHGGPPECEVVHEISNTCNVISQNLCSTVSEDQVTDATSTQKSSSKISSASHNGSLHVDESVVHCQKFSSSTQHEVYSTSKENFSSPISAGDTNISITTSGIDEKTNKHPTVEDTSDVDDDIVIADYDEHINGFADNAVFLANRQTSDDTAVAKNILATIDETGSQAKQLPTVEQGQRGDLYSRNMRSVSIDELRYGFGANEHRISNVDTTTTVNIPRTSECPPNPMASYLSAQSLHAGERVSHNQAHTEKVLASLHRSQNINGGFATPPNMHAIASTTSLYQASDVAAYKAGLASKATGDILPSAKTVRFVTSKKPSGAMSTRPFPGPTGALYDWPPSLSSSSWKQSKLLADNKNGSTGRSAYSLNTSITSNANETAVDPPVQPADVNQHSHHASGFRVPPFNPQTFGDSRKSSYRFTHPPNHAYHPFYPVHGISQDPPHYAPRAGLPYDPVTSSLGYRCLPPKNPLTGSGMGHQKPLSVRANPSFSSTDESPDGLHADAGVSIKPSKSKFGISQPVPVLSITNKPTVSGTKLCTLEADLSATAKRKLDEISTGSGRLLSDLPSGKHSLVASPVAANNGKSFERAEVLRVDKSTRQDSDTEPEAPEDSLQTVVESHVEPGTIVLKKRKTSNQDEQEPPRKRARLSSVTASFIAGALAGGLGVFGALVSLPESLFQ